MSVLPPRRFSKVADADGGAGGIQWNCEKFLIGKDAQVVVRIRPRTEPEAAAIETLLAAWPRPEFVPARPHAPSRRVLSLRTGSQ
jgi:hypothetical protein